MGCSLMIKYGRQDSRRRVSEHAAPLQCAGVTVYWAPRDTISPGKRVGIAGMGGLGYLIIQCKCTSANSFELARG